MTDPFRWQWVWKSRGRLIALAVAAVALGGAAAAAVLSPGPFRKGHGLMLYGGITLVALGLYQLLQGLLSPAGAFGDHDDAAEEELHRKRVRRLRRRAASETGTPRPPEADSTPGDDRDGR